MKGLFGLLILGLVSAASAQWDLTPVPVSVPESMRWWPFDLARTLNVPPNTSVEVVARVGGARFMAVAPNGDIFVSKPWEGKVVVVRPQAGSDPLIFDYATGLNLPHDVVFHTIGQTTYVYIAETNRIARYTYTTGNTTGQNRQVVVDNLPDSSLPELGGNYGHALKNIALDSSNRLYVSIASSSNAWAGDATSDPIRCAIYRYNADGTGRTLFARGLRNAEGLAFYPGTTTLWATINHRDNVKYPHNDSTGNYGYEVGSYIDNHPPDGFTRVVSGGNYGWPYANPSPDSLGHMNFPPYDPDYDNNPLWANFPQVNFTRLSKGVQAHSAPLGVTFFPGTQAPAAWRNGVAVGLHGSWNRGAKTGYKVTYYPAHADSRNLLGYSDFVTGWLNEESQDQWGRPVDIAVEPTGGVLISDDYSGTIYRLRHTPPTNTSWVEAVIQETTGTDTIGRNREREWSIFTTDVVKNPGSRIISELAAVGDFETKGLSRIRRIFYPGGNTNGGKQIQGTDGGFSFSVAADTSLQTIRFYLGAEGSSGRLRLKLSDSATEYEVPAKNLPTSFYGYAQITFRASSPGQRLSVSWTNRSSNGNVIVQAVSLLPARR
jgi:glucose/arabinose dehydrogenase